MTTQEKVLLTPEEAGRQLGMHRKTVLRRIAIWRNNNDDPRGLPAINWSGVEGPGARWLLDPVVVNKRLKEWLTAAA